jgi:lipid A 3-O-deacylase
MKKLIASSGLALACLVSGPAVLAADFSGSVGTTDDGSMVYRLGTQFGFSDSWLQSDVGQLSGYWDAGYSYWESGHGSDGNNSLSFAPVFVYEFAGQGVRPFIEAGIGVALFSSTKVDGNELGQAFQFEDRIGLGVRFSGQEVGVRALHYSNAGMQDPNDGVESYSLYYSASL